VDHVHVDAERLGERRELALPHERREAARQGDRAQRGRLRPVEARALKGVAQHAPVEARAVGHQHPTLQQLREAPQHVGGLGRRVHHRLRDASEALYPARERVADSHERLPLVVQLAPADHHRADLRQLAQVAAAAVRLHVHGEELGAGQLCVREAHDRVDTPPAGRHARVLSCPGPAGPD
jgi:hypothetical protein